MNEQSGIFDVRKGPGRHGFQGFLSTLQADDRAHISPQRYAEKLQLGVPQLAKLARVHRSTIYKAPDTEQLQKFLRNSVRVLAAATNFSGDLNRAVFWYRNHPIDVLDYKTAEELVSEGRTDQVLRYIDTLEAGTG